MSNALFEEIILEGEFLHKWFVRNGNKDFGQVPVEEQLTNHRVSSYFVRSKCLIEQTFGSGSKEFHSWKATVVAWDKRYSEMLAEIENRKITDSRGVAESNCRNQVKRFEETLLLLKELRIQNEVNYVKNLKQDKINDRWYKQSHYQFGVNTSLAVAAIVVAIVLEFFFS